VKVLHTEPNVNCTDRNGSRSVVFTKLATATVDDMTSKQHFTLQTLT